MRIQFQAMLALAFIGLAVVSIPAFSRPNPNGLEQDVRSQSERAAPRAGNKATRKKVAKKKSLKKRVVYRPGVAVNVPSDERYPNLERTPANGWPTIVAEARKYIGTNPTEMQRRWCARFMNMVLNKLGYNGTGSDAARSFAKYGQRISQPRVGAIAVLSRGKSKTQGHVGVISGLDARGNPIIISGNHGRRVAESVYPRSRVIAYVMPTGRARTMLADNDLPDLKSIFARASDRVAFVAPAHAAETRRDAQVIAASRVRAAQQPRVAQQMSAHRVVQQMPAQRTAQLQAQPSRAPQDSQKPEFARSVEAAMARMISSR